ncbi:MAG: DEAD/DEAH box helicase family protein [Chloroflexi bacterium]|nr:DEAD/DEAH box helicase family protein [Chloroflexota bacterium]
MELHEALAAKVDTWRAAGYPGDVPALAEILDFAVEGVEPGAPWPHSGQLRFLRAAQLRAFETYWYLRVVERTPPIPDLYRRLFPTTSERLAALGLNTTALTTLALDVGYDGLIEQIRTDDAFVKAHKLGVLRETLTLDYPSYILALAMGAGKTVLIGAIVATEFALALENPEPPEGIRFIENALVFAPGTTIIESLRELSTIPFAKLLPPRLLAPFEASLKVTFTRDDERGIPVVAGSRFNLVVTNTEKIRIQAIPKRRQLTLASLLDTREQEATERANLRLQAIASLPHLGVFSDEAHHTYGQNLETQLKRVRQTVDYLGGATNLIAVINTTGTPYFERQPLRDVVVWYGLGQGIRDGILKDVANNIQSFAFEADQADEFVSHVVTDFLDAYGDHALPDGAPAKLAIYFPQVDDLEELDPHVQLAVAKAGLPPTVILRNHSRSSTDEVDAFNRLNDPTSGHRVILLVNKGTEGWNCPSLFATALARKLKTSNNFVLQAASRCLRQVPGNDRSARIYLSDANRSALDTQLKDTYGETIGQLEHQRRATTPNVIRLRKTDLPPIRLRVPRRVLVRGVAPAGVLAFERPTAPTHGGAMTRTTYGVGLANATRKMLSALGDTLEIETSVDTIDAYTAAMTLAATYRLDAWPLIDALRQTYGAEEIPVSHLEPLARLLEERLGPYEETIEHDDVELAIVRPDGFDAVTQADGSVVRQSDIAYPADRAHLVFGPERVAGENPAGYGFHYTPYNFDSGPEADFYEKVLRALNVAPDDVREIYFTGAITDPKKTDLSFVYRREGRDHRYTPDFVIHARGDRWLLVEIKMTARRHDDVEGEEGVKAKAIRGIADANPGRIFYRMIFADAVVSAPDVVAVGAFVEGAGG